MDTIARLRRLQVLTILLVLAACAALGYDHFVRQRQAAPGGPAGLDEAAVRAEVQRALDDAQKRAAPAAAAAAGELAALREKVGALEGKLAAAQAQKPAAGASARIVAYDRRTLVRLRSRASGGIEFRVTGELPADAWPLPESADLPGGEEWRPLAAEPRAAVELPEIAGLEEGALHVTVHIRTNKDTSETPARPQRLWLACSGAAGEQARPLAGQFFPFLRATGDALLKVAATSGLYAVGPDARFRLIVDATALAGKLNGTMDVYVQAGPLIATGPAERGAARREGN